MADVVVVYLSEDESATRKLVEILRTRWSTWWDKDIAEGDWETIVRREIDGAVALVPVLSGHAKGARIAILKDEVKYAREHSKLIFPFIIGDADVPFGLGGLNHTKAHNWSGDASAQGCRDLVAKIASTLSSNHTSAAGARPRALSVRGKSLRLPAFAFSLSSHETQVKPKDGIQLLNLLRPDACLISAYDFWKNYRRDRLFKGCVKEIRGSDSVLYLDSGNYEADRKNDRRSRRNPKGWRREYFVDAAKAVRADIVFSFDDVRPNGSRRSVAKATIESFKRDADLLGNHDSLLCPIVHLPRTDKGTDPADAPKLLHQIAKALDPPMLAIPERELGDGLLERVSTVKAIRRELNSLGVYYPVHLLGTGNPLTMVALAVAGADSFDGLEWCRTVSDYENGYLFHFQHFDLFSETCITRVKDPRIRAVLQDARASYPARVACFNVDAFNDWTKTLQDMIHAAQDEHLLKMIPNVGSLIFANLKQ